jgi:stage V sporulation protein AD
MVKRTGSYTISFLEPPVITGYGAVAGKKEAEGPIGKCFQKIYYDSRAGQKTWEKAEARFQQDAFTMALEKSGNHPEDIDYIFAGDLLNQLISSSYSMRAFNIPYLGQYGACSTMAQGLIMSSMAVAGGSAVTAGVVTSSHFCTAERQYRYPLEYGGVRPQTAQWTVTGSGSAIISKSGKGINICHGTVGKIVDKGVTDLNNMGAAMAPAAVDTLLNFFRDTQTSPEDYDRIYTGDLGQVGTDIFHHLLQQKGYNVNQNHRDCGLIIFDREKQDVHAGGSGCGCGASVLCGNILPQMEQGKLSNILFMATGALMSPTSSQQGESIPSVAHLVHLSIAG